MQFITTGNRIAVENFTLGDLYTITFTSGTYINSACIGIGENFVSFQRNEPELLFTLNMETAELVSSIDLYAGGTGTNNYNELSNKPQIGGVELVGNKSLSDLGIQAEITEESPLSSSLVSGLGSAAAADSSDFATAAQGAVAETAIQSAGSGLSKDGTTLNHSNSVTAKTTEGFAAITYDAQGHITGSTAATTAQLAALNSGITSTDVAQIETNKTNILSAFEANGTKNKLTYTLSSLKALNTGGSWSGNVYTNGKATFTVNSDMTITAKASGIASTSEVFRFYLQSFTASSGDMLCSGLATANANLFLYTQSGDTYTTSAPDIQYEASDVGVARNITMLVRENTTGTLFKPMVCDKTLYDISPTYQPHALSNVELTAKEQQNETNILSVADNPNKNRLYFDGVYPTDLAGVVYTINPDMSITADVSGKTGTSIVILAIDGSYTNVASLCNGNYMLSGCPSGGGNDTYQMYAAGGSYTQRDYGNGVELVSTSIAGIYAVIRIESGYTGGNITFKPMICSKSLWESGYKAYAPYTPTIAEIKALLAT